jgi:tetratricopeptide (TPR) repeat protein
MAVWVFAQLAATLLSPLPIISFFGGDEARSGYNLYDSLSLVVIFASVALRFRTLRSLELLTYTLVATGTLAAAYGIAQHFGWDPIGGNAGRTRAISSFGNTLNFGGYMVMSIPATLALAYKKLDRKWIWLAIVAGALSLQLAGIWFSGGRGPFVAGAASIISFFVIAIALGGTKQTLKSVGVIAVSTVIAAIIVALPSEQGDIGLERAISITNQFSSETGSTDIKGGLAGRFNIWGSAVELATSWELPIEEPVTNKVLRPLFGLGPDMLVYAFPLVGQPQSDLALLDHAHNYSLQILLEQGFIGLFGFLMMGALLAIAVFAIVRRVRRSGRNIDAASLLILALAPAMIGKMFELQSGVARISDLAMNFALFGATIAIYEIVNRNLNDENPPEVAEEQPTTSSSVNFAASNQTVLLSAVLVALVVTTAVVSIFATWDLRRLSASRVLVVGYDHPELTKRANAWTNAQQLAPERESFTFTLFEQYLKVSKEQFALGNEQEALRLLTVGRDMLLEYEKRDPLELDTQIGLSKATSTLMVWGYHEYTQELADRAIKLAEGNPAYPTLLGTSATALASVGLHELAIKYADQAIATEDTTQPWSKAWYAKGRSLFELGRVDDAIEALITATEKQPGAEGALLSHQVLAEIYKDRGEIEQYELHKELGGSEVTFQE